MNRLFRPALAAMALVAAVAPARAQTADQPTHASQMTEFAAGDMFYRTFIHFAFSSETAEQIVLAPGDGLSGASFRTKPDGTPSWGEILHVAGYNVYMLDNVGCGRAATPPTDDFSVLAEKAMYGVQQIGQATNPRFYVAHGQSAGLLLKARSIEPLVARTLVLIDPIGPQGSQPMTTLTPAKVLERWNDRANWIWRTWGFGPRYGELRRGIDVTLDEARAMVDGFDVDAPAYWTALLTPMNVPLSVREGYNLQEVPVLVIRTPAADREQIEREDAVVAWMQSMGMRVDRLDLTRDPQLKNVSGLPWIGDLAEPVLDRIRAWADDALAGVESGVGR